MNLRQKFAIRDQGLKALPLAELHAIATSEFAMRAARQGLDITPRVRVFKNYRGRTVYAVRCGKFVIAAWSYRGLARNMVKREWYRFSDSLLSKVWL